MMGNKSIIFQLGAFSIGGVERVTVVLANELLKRGWHVAIAVCEINNRFLLSKLDNKVEVIKFANGWLSHDNCIMLNKYIMDKKVSFVINQWCTPYKVTKFLRKAIGTSGAKLIAVHHNRPDTNKRIMDAKSPLIRAMFRFITRINLKLVYHHSDKYIVLCKSFVGLLKDFIGVSGEKISYISNPLTISPVIKNKENLLIYVGRLEETQKRVSRLFDTEYEWPLVIVGDGPDSKIYEERAKYNKRIEFVGFQNPSDYYARAKVLLLPSDFEGFPLVLCEAMASGCVPVALGSYASAYDILGNGGGVVVDPPYNSDEFASVVKSLISDPIKLSTLSESARKRSEVYSVKSVVDDWERLLTNL